MKKIVCLLSVLIIGQITFCQTRILKMNEWTEVYEERIGTEDHSCSLTVYNIEGDTTINSIDYRKLYKNGKLSGAIRETADSVVYYYDIKYKKELLLYDFAWKIGKEIKSVWLDEWDGISEDIPEYVYATVTKIDTLTLEDGKKYAYITTTHGTKCIQGIGDTEGFTSHLSLLSPTCPCAQKLWCAIDSKSNNSDFIIYKDEQCDDCYTCNEKLAIIESNNGITLSPNPVKDKLTVTLPNANNEIKIFDLQGKLWLQQNGGFSAEINVSMLPAGMYVLVVNEESYKFVKE
ncbi:MAG: T9SS type A sorting domain-containing protein [Bacteroidales bacterium]|nr:T9SS type A sorting domain-containing protein [Bacteroidales bacterium]